MADSGDRMFCHACGGVWLRNQRGLTCPYCESDFTEIIEIPPDHEATDPEETFPHSTPPRARSPVNPWENHNPWANQEGDDIDDPHGFGPGLGNGYSHRTYRSQDGRFSFTSTTFGGGFPSARATGHNREPSDPLMPMVQSLDTIFQGLANTYRQQNREQAQQAQQARDQARETPRQDDTEHEHPSRAPEFGAQGAQGATGRLFPRDANGPQPMAPPLGTLSDILELFRSDFGAAPGHAGAGAAGGPNGPGGVRVMTGPNPLAMLSTLLNLDRHGDAVYSQEEMDRVISQLVEQAPNGSAPPPAAASSIRALPKKPVDQEMLGSDGKAECSICMDPVELGTEVTELPCKHWFHFSCIEVWLNQHNTCPQCRRSIDAPAQSEGSSDNPVVIDDSPEPMSPESRFWRANAQYGGELPRGVSNTWDTNNSDRRRSSRDGAGGGFTSWVRSRFTGGN